MTKEFVPYELAVKLKELGFDEPCFATWSGEILDMSLQIPSDDYFTKAPIFSQAFRWFKEKYDVNGYQSIYQTMNSGYALQSMEENDQTDCYFKTYEEAELACLTKLIEIVEQQNQK